MKYSCEKWAQIANGLLDVVFESFGAEWCVAWAIDNGLTDEEIFDIIIDDKELIAKVRKESEEI